MHISKLFDLTGKVALVTGGSRGLGKEFAEGLGEAGAKVAITGRREKWLTPTADELKAVGIDCLPIQGDVSSREDVQRFVSETVKKWGKIDILINNAGVGWGSAPEDFPLDKWDEVTDIDLKGVLICSQEFGKQMMKQKSGNIINIASYTGINATHPQIMQALAYQVSKAGVIILTKQLAVEWAVHNIRVNAIAPFFFPTRLAEWSIEHGGERLINWIPMARTGKDDELKGVAVFLAAEASSYITGQVISVDGGATAW